MHRPAPAPSSAWHQRLRAVGLAVLVALVLRGSIVELVRVPSGSMVPALAAGDVVLVSKLAYSVRLPFTQRALAELGVPRRGDVVVFKDPRDPLRSLAKRVVGLPGDLIELREQVLHVNGVPQPRLLLGDLTYDEAAPGAPPRVDTCQAWRELLATGPVRPQATPGIEGERAAWDLAAASGAAAHPVLECRRVRAGRVEGPWGPVPPGHVLVLGDNRDRAGDGRSTGDAVVPLGALVGRAALVAWSGAAGGWWPPDRARIDRLFKPVE